MSYGDMYDRPGPHNNYGYGMTPQAAAPPPPPPPKKSKLVPILIVAVGVLVAALVVTLAVVTSGGDADAEATPTSSAEAQPTQTLSLADQDVAFYRWVNRHPWSQNGSTQEDWTELGSAMCGALDRGGRYDDVATILIDELDDFTTSDARAFVGKAVEVYCPEHADKVD